MRKRTTTRSWVHRILVVTATMLSVYGFAFTPTAEGCPTFRGCYEGCYCETGGGDGECGYCATHNACGCMTLVGVLHTNDCKADVVEE